MKNRRITVIVVVSAIAILVILGVIWLNARTQSQQITAVEVVSVQPPICTQSVVDQQCGDGVITIETKDGAEIQYTYASDIRVESGNETAEITSLKEGDLVELEPSQGGKEILSIRKVE